MSTRKQQSPAGLPEVPIAVSYIRFSSPRQVQGDSLRRQTAATEAWCRRNGIALDHSLSLRDLGVSAFRGKHRCDKAALGGFLRLVEAGKVPRGSFLIIENLDRLSREEERTALRLWLDILDHGINIVQLQPEVIFHHERSDFVDIIRAILELGRGHSESRLKSQRNEAAWVNKRRRARIDGTILTHRLPSWLQETNGQLHPIAEKVAAIHRVFALAAEGHFYTQIVKRMIQENVPAIGPSGRWNRGVVRSLLTDRRVLGELRPRRGGRKEGRPLVGYYPAIVTPREFYLARAGLRMRRRRPRTSSFDVPHLFAGLLRHGPTGKEMLCREYQSRGKGCRLLLSPRSQNLKSSRCSILLTVVERALLAELVEIDPAAFAAAVPEPQPAVITEELARLRGRKAELQAQLDRAAVAALESVLQNLENQEENLIRQLEEANERVAQPLLESWCKVKNLAGGVLTSATPEAAGPELQSALRRIVAEIWLVPVSRGHDRLCEAQVWFAGGQAFRSYTILYRRSFVERPGAWVIVSGDHPDSAAAGLPCPTKDLRDRKQAEAVRMCLRQLPHETITRLLQTGAMIPGPRRRGVPRPRRSALLDGGSDVCVPSLPSAEGTGDGEPIVSDSTMHGVPSAGAADGSSDLPVPFSSQPPCSEFTQKGGAPSR